MEEKPTWYSARWATEAAGVEREVEVSVVLAETETMLLDCPACGGWYVEDTPCECGYCPHPGITDGICPACGAEVEPTMAELVAELLDAADCALTDLAITVTLAGNLNTITRLRQIVTRLQGTAGLRVVRHG